MWINPKYADRYPQPAERSRVEPPAETGRRLATFPRGKHGDPVSELRVSLAEYQGHEFVSVRLWQANRDGDLWPTKSGCSIRLREVEAFVEALREAAELAGEPLEQGERRKGAGPPRRSAGDQGGR